MSNNLVSRLYDDMSTSHSSESAYELEDIGKLENGINNDPYINELEDREKYVQDFINKSFQHFKSGIDFYIHNQDMNYYKETSRCTYTDVDDRPMLGSFDDDSQEATSSETAEVDPVYDAEINKLLDEVIEGYIEESPSIPIEENAKVKTDYDLADPKREQYEDYYNEFPEDTHIDQSPPPWYQKMLQSKIKETKNRLGNLSNLICYVCASTGAHIKRIEQDHSTTFCKMDYPRHPPLNKPWRNVWKFDCIIKCSEIDKPNHAHTADCESLLLEHEHTKVSLKTTNVSENEYPKFVMHAVDLFQDFAIETTKSMPYLDPSDASDTVYEKPVWSYIKLRSNYKNELLMIVRGKAVTSLLSKLKRYYETGPGKTSNVVSVFCINQRWSQKKGKFPATNISGLSELKDKVGPISITYDWKTNHGFNSVEAIQLGKIIQDYAGLTLDTTFLDVGCNFGVLSLMMAHKCDRVIGLNTMHFATSEIIQAEQLKKFNKIHNSSFMACDPKDVLTKIGPLIKRNVTVAALNLSSPFGKSVHVMEALRDLPSIWRVVVYGSFTKEFHRNISLLTSKDDQAGDHYLPMQGCILDKSPSVADAFDIVILFERKSLISQSVELLAPGPTLNIKSDIDSNYGSLDNEEVKPLIKLEKGFGNKYDNRSRKFHRGKFMKYRGQLSRFGKFDSPMLPMDRDQKPENSKDKPKERSPSPPFTERKFDCSVLRQKPLPFLSDHRDSGRGRPAYLSIRKDLQVKELKRIYDSPSLPISKEANLPSTTRNRSPSPSATERKPFDCSVLRKQRQFDSSALKNLEKPPQQPKDNQSLSIFDPPIKQEPQFDSPFPPQEKFPSPPPPPPSTENYLLDSSEIKKEKDVNHPIPIAVKTEPIGLPEDKEEGELSPEDDGVSRYCIKSKPVNPSYFLGFTEVNCENIPMPVTIKPEPMDSYETSLKPETVNNVSEDMQISPNLEDIENMETPVHNPRALSTTSSPLPVSTNVTTVDGFKFSVKANQSFLAIKQEPVVPREQTNATINVKTEPVENEQEMDEEIKIIGETKSAVHPSREPKLPDQPKIRVKSLSEIIKVKSEIDQNDDLRTLIEQRKVIQRQLDQEEVAQKYAPTSNSSRKYKLQSLPTHPSFKKYNRSPSPRKFRRSPSPTRFNRSPSSTRFRRSPSSTKFRRSPTPTRFRRSPSSTYRYRSTFSPSRTWLKREKSPNTKRYRRSPLSPTRIFIKRELSPDVKRFRRSRSPNERYSRRSPSPNERYSRRSPPSPSERYSKRTPPSPSERYLKRSPPSPSERYISRSPSSPSVRYSRRSSPSPSVRYSRRSPPSPLRFKKEPLSPMSNRYKERIRRSPTSSTSPQTFTKWEIRGKIKSPVRARHGHKRSRSRSQSPKIRHKRRSISPVISSPSPARRENGIKEHDALKKKKKKTKTKSKSKSKSPCRALKKKRKTISDNSQWDIPALSTLSTTQSSPIQDEKTNVEVTTESYTCEQKESVEQKRASRSRSRTPIPGVDDIPIKVELSTE